MRATIDDTTGVFTLVNTFVTKPENANAIVASLREFTESYTRTLPGFVSASVHRSKDGRRVINYVQWSDTAAFEAMFQSPQAKRHMNDVRALAEAVDPVFYDVVYVNAKS